MPDRSTLYSPRHVVVLAHPSHQSFNGLVADAYCQAVRHCGQEAIVRDLYAIGFDPVLKDKERPRGDGFVLSADVSREREIIASSDVFVLIFPIWFGMPPAILKGYIDRVLGAGVTPHDVQSGEGTPLLKDRLLVSITSSGTSKLWLNQQHQLESLRTLLGTYLVHGFGMRGFKELHFGETTEGLPQPFVDALVGRVQQFAAEICDGALRSRAGAPASLPERVSEA